MKSITLPQYNSNVLRAILSLKAEQTKRLHPGINEVLIKVYASPVNPSDIAFIQGTYNVVKTLPAVPGFEGSGLIVETNPELAHLLGKKVSFFIQEDSPGSWSEFVITGKDNLIILDEEMDLDQAACFAINPFTAFGLFSIAVQRKTKAIIINAAGGQVPSFIRNLANEYQIEVVNVVRKSETAENLRTSGVYHVLDETEENFVEKLKTLAHQLKATLAFDAVGGSQSGYLFNAMPPDSELVVYGGLSNKPMTGINVMEVIFHNKHISGFNLSPWIQELEADDFNRISKLLQDKFIFKSWCTSIQSIVALDDVVVGLKHYLGNMSAGKVLIKP